MMRRLQRSLDPELLSKFQIICSRVRDIEPDKIKILWLHDRPCLETKNLGDPEYRKQFARIVMVSDWQMHAYHYFLDLPFSECRVIRNGIEPISAQPKPDPDDCINLIYHTIPSRGLALLAGAFDYALQKFDRLHLHVFSSYAAYNQPEADRHYQQIFDWCRNNPHVTYHGFQPNQVVREALRNTHIFAYPALVPETFCLAAVEAMSSGNLIVAPNYGGLTDICNRWPLSYQWHENRQEHMQIFADTLLDAISMIRNDRARYEAHIAAQKDYADRFYDWKLIAPVWDRMLRELLPQ